LAVYYHADVLYYDNYVETHMNNIHFFNTNTITKYNPGVKWEHLPGDLKVAAPLWDRLNLYTLLVRYILCVPAISTQPWTCQTYQQHVSFCILYL